MINLEMEFILGNLCVEIEVWSKKENQFIETDALFDTGAHTTHIDTNALKRLGYDIDNAEKGYISTVGSRNIEINNMAIDNIKIGDLELGAVLINFSELSDINSPAIILGMNIIKEFNINLDFKNNIMTLKPNFDVNSVLSVEKFSKGSSRFGMWAINKT
jgi:predicted aspartyl protease